MGTQYLINTLYVTDKRNGCEVSDLGMNVHNASEEVIYKNGRQKISCKISSLYYFFCVGKKRFFIKIV